MQINTAILMILASQLIAALGAILIKQLGADLPIMQLILFRQLFAAIIMIPLLYKLFGCIKKSPYQKIHMFRGLMIAVSNVAFLIALLNLPLVTVTAVVYLSPIILVLFSASLLGERQSSHKIITVCVGFVGILLISKPHEFNLYVLVAAVAAVGVALNNVCLKRVAAKEHPMVTLFWSNLYTVLLVIPLVFWEGAAVTGTVINVALILALMYIAMTYFIIYALRKADASRLAAAQYSGLIFAAVLGYWLFNEHLDFWTWVGISVVIMSVLLPSKKILRAAKMAG
ncbi:MAG: hypothetical protein OFPI_37750 [Osedax symbiont Rs2]|nr:MAG: hypothetical protein OFPI_37750 [Osedax symbiont Rs2]